jgi:hypothetical protein
LYDSSTFCSFEILITGRDVICEIRGICAAVLICLDQAAAAEKEVLQTRDAPENKVFPGFVIEWRG